MKELGVHMIPSYSPQARGRSERNFSTWQGRLPQELRLHGIRTLEGANKFLNEHAGCKVIVHQHLDETITLTIGAHRVGHYSGQGKLLTPLSKKQIKAVEKTRGGKVKKTTFPPHLQIPHTTQDSHFTTASTTTG